MELTRRNLLVYGLILGVWLLVVGWQVEEHIRVREAAKADLRGRSKDIANTLSAILRNIRFRGVIPEERLKNLLNELVNGRTNELVKSSELISIELRNAANVQIAAAGKPIDPQNEAMQRGERWGAKSVTLVNPVDLGAALTSEGETNATFIVPTPPPPTNGMREGRGSPRREPRPGEPAPPPPDNAPGTAVSTNLLGASTNLAGPPPEREGRRRDGEGRRGRPPWLRWMDEKEYQALIEKRGLHGLVLALSTESIENASSRDLWLRSIILVLATILAVGSGLVWQNLVRVSDLQIRLVRASEMNTHLKEMNLAAAGLAHETRNPLNIIRGIAHMISKESDAAPEIRTKTREIIDEADKVAAQLNEFINYSRPREVRRTVLPLGSVVKEVVRTLNYDLEEKKINLQVQGEQLSIQADEQLLRQALFNLLLNAIQAVNGAGEIQISAQKSSASEASLEVRDNGPGVPVDRRTEIFKPYFTTQKTGTGLGLAVVQQIVLAHGWDIACLANEPKGAVFRISHLKLAA
jgi:signal transduction histidine kinase